MKLTIIISLFIFQSCGYGQYPRTAVNECGRIVRIDKVNNVCEFDSSIIKK